MTVETGKSMFNPEIWPVPISKPDSYYLGLAFTEISLKQIPFAYAELNPGNMIENERGEVLMYKGTHYELVTNSPGSFLSMWFCKWTKL